MKWMRQTMTVLGRELRSYFSSPVAYVFLIVFLLLINFLPLAVGRYYENGQADLRGYSFFAWFPWVFLLLVPAATMRLWAEERRSGTIELLLTLPLTLSEAIVGKFLAAWIFLGLAIALTFPLALTTYYLGSPDTGVILTGYAGCFLLAGGYVAIGVLTSAMTRNQVIGFVLAVVISLFLLLAGWPPVIHFLVRWAPLWLVHAVGAFSFMSHFEAMQRGVIALRDLVYFASLAVFMLYGAYLVLDSRKSS